MNGVEGRMDASEIALILLSEIEPRKQKADAALHSLTFFNKFGFSSDLRQQVENYILFGSGNE